MGKKKVLGFRAIEVEPYADRKQAFLMTEKKLGISHHYHHASKSIRLDHINHPFITESGGRISERSVCL